MLNWAWAELCSSRVWQYSMMLAHTWVQRTAPLRSLTIEYWCIITTMLTSLQTLFQCHFYPFLPHCPLHCWTHVKGTLGNFLPGIHYLHYIHCCRNYKIPSNLRYYHPHHTSPTTPFTECFLSDLLHGHLHLLSSFCWVARCGDLSLLQQPLPLAPRQTAKQGQTEALWKKKKKKRIYTLPTVQLEWTCISRDTGDDNDKNKSSYVTWNLLMWPWNSRRAALLTSPPTSRAPERPSSTWTTPSTESDTWICSLHNENLKI